MRRWIACVVFLPFLAMPIQAGGKDATEDVVARMLGQLEKMAEALGSMKDEESAASAREGLKKNVAAFRELRLQADKLPPPSREVKDRLAKEYKKKFVDVQEKLMLEVTRIRATVPGGRDALTEVSGLLRGGEIEGKKEKKKEPEVKIK